MKQTKANNLKWNDCIDMINTLEKSKLRNRKVVARLGVEGQEGLLGEMEIFYHPI